MQVVKGKTLDTGRRVVGFLDNEAADIGTAVTPPLRAKLDDAIEQLATAGIAQASAESNGMTETLNQSALRKALYDDGLGHMSRVARSAIELKDKTAVLAVPAVAARGVGFVGKVTAAVDAAAQYEAVFVANGLAPDFIAQLRAGIARVVASQEAQQKYIATRVTATGAIETADKAVRDTIGFVDAALRPVLKKNQTLATGWKSAKLIRATVVNPNPTGSPLPLQAPSENSAGAAPSSTSVAKTPISE
jgi:hypothetical protein